MPRPLDSVRPVVSGPGNAIGPEGPVGPSGPPGNQPIDVQIFTGEGATHPYSLGMLQFMVKYGLARNDPEALRIR